MMREYAPKKLAIIYFFGILAAYSFVILTAAAPPPFVDYPDWVYQGVLFHGVLTGHPVAGYAMKHYPVPNSLTTVGLGLLDTVMPWQWAGKLWIVLYLALAAFAIWTLTGALKLREGRLLIALPAIVIVNLNFWYGHISFEIGMCLVLLLLAMLVRDVSSGWLAAMLVLIFFTHMEACAGAMLLLGIWCVVTRRWEKIWVALPAVALTIWYGVARFSGGNAESLGAPAPGANDGFGSPRFMLYKANTFFKTFGYINARGLDGLSQSEQILGKVVFVALVAASLLLAALCIVKMLRACTLPTASAFRRVVEWFTLSLLVLSAVLPQVWLGVADPGSRLLLMATAVGLLIVEWRGRTGLAVACLSAFFCVVNLWQFACVERDPRMEGRPQDLIPAILLYGHVEPGARLKYYDDLQRGKMDEIVFTTALFVKTSK